MAHILVVEDEKGLAFGLQANFAYDGHQVDVCLDGADAVEIIRSTRPDLIVLDLILPGMSGMDVLREIRASDIHIPVVVLSALSSEIDVVAALRAGADDYVTKPFSLLELMERVSLRLRAPDRGADEQPRVDLHLKARCVTIEGMPVILARKEFELLAALMDASPEALSREEIERRVWGQTSGHRSRTIDVHIGRLRKKLRERSVDRCLLTVHGYGFRWSGPVDQLR